MGTLSPRTTLFHGEKDDQQIDLSEGKDSGAVTGSFVIIMNLEVQNDVERDYRELKQRAFWMHPENARSYLQVAS
ncbi:MAG: hypothetical protein DWH91_14710 [Planctomycetota bacterium]|nr:MAG: hypothetical protein DWH91_14710 [Planctomycetota bacterium]